MKPKYIALLLAILLAGCSSAPAQTEAVKPNPPVAPAATAMPAATPAAPLTTASYPYPGPQNTATAAQPGSSAYPYPQPSSNALIASTNAYPYPNPSPNGAGVPSQPLAASARFSIAMVDKVIEAVMSGNAPALASLVSYTQAPCTTKEGLSGPPKCAAGEADGTKLDVLPVQGMEGGFVRKSGTILSDLPAQVDLMGVFQVNPGYHAQPYYPAGQYGIVFRFKTKGGLVILRIDASGVVREDFAQEFPDKNMPDFDKYLQPAP